MFGTRMLHTFHRFKTLFTHQISALPIVILMPHSACNCRCIMCDIWKDNKNLKQLTEEDVASLLSSLKKFQTRQVVMSGGEALLNPHFFRLCGMLKQLNIHITLLSTGLLLKKHAAKIVTLVDDVIVSLDGDETTHDLIRNIPGCYRMMKEGIEAIKALDPTFKITGRTVIHKLNFRIWPAIIQSARELQLQQISFLPADVSSTAFNREIKWNTGRQQEVMLSIPELQELQGVLEKLITHHQTEFDNHFIAESPDKLRKIYGYYAALHLLNDFPLKKCNAPWVSAVIEADGAVRPCFFHKVAGNIREASFTTILNSKPLVQFRKELDINTNDTCKKCVCYLNLPVTADPSAM